MGGPDDCFFSVVFRSDSFFGVVFFLCSDFFFGVVFCSNFSGVSNQPLRLLRGATIRGGSNTGSILRALILFFGGNANTGGSIELRFRGGFRTFDDLRGAARMVGVFRGGGDLRGGGDFRVLRDCRAAGDCRAAVFFRDN